ncbi:DUF6527 family protein [Mesorhizobium sp.]|uniref:DUF6527 family protein n=1 Tax=Mesorhizobium sp. TaxID=1871066 RepID=UPI000FE8D3EB|nr:DUF6527 family protein [Mesorhizobium sp.]RWK68288.1 MAG: hypothetical protein EOR54_14720 [Mesorhizobium sp.]
MRALACKILVVLRLIPRPAFTARLVSGHPDPDTMADGQIYVVGGRGYSKWAYFRCPADREEIVQLSLMPERRPRWTVAVDWLGRPTINPSVRQLDGSYAHFWIRRGRVDWCADSGRGVRRV